MGRIISGFHAFFHPKIIHKALPKIFLSGAGASSEIGAGDGGEDVTRGTAETTSPKRLAKNGVSERLFFDVLRSGRKESEVEAIWQDGERAEAREERTEHPGRERGRDGETQPFAGKSRAGRGNKEPARSERARRRREERPTRPAAARSCLIFCQPPLINRPPSSSERAEPRVPGNPARSFLAEAGPAERLHLHKVPRLPRRRGCAGQRRGWQGRRASQAGREEELRRAALPG